MWRFRGDESRRRRGCDADVPRRSASRRRRGCDVEIPWRRASAAATRTFRGDEPRGAAAAATRTFRGDQPRAAGTTTGTRRRRRARRGPTSTSRDRAEILSVGPGLAPSFERTAPAVRRRKSRSKRPQLGRHRSSRTGGSSRTASASRRRTAGTASTIARTTSRTTSSSRRESSRTGPSTSTSSPRFDPRSTRWALSAASSRRRAASSGSSTGGRAETFRLGRLVSTECPRRSRGVAANRRYGYTRHLARSPRYAGQAKNRVGVEAYAEGLIGDLYPDLASFCLDARFVSDVLDGSNDVATDGWRS